MSEVSRDTGPSLLAVKPGVKEALIGAASEAFNCTHLSAHKGLIIHDDFKDKGIVFIDGVLSKEECSHLRNAIDSCSKLSFWNAEGRTNETARLFRDADTIEVEQHPLERSIWKRVCGLFDQNSVIISEDDASLVYDRDMIGSWFPHGLNYNFLFAKYPSGGHFAPHTDGRVTHDFNTRSISSVIIFLNTIPIEGGGGTRFYTSDVLQNLRPTTTGQWTGSAEYVITEVGAVEGRMLVFDQQLVHEGMICVDPHVKYIIRSDIMYERRPNICATETDKEAYRLYKEAEYMAEAGNVEESIPMFKRAFRLSPRLAELLGH